MFIDLQGNFSNQVNMINATYSDKNTVVAILEKAFDENKSVNYIIVQDRHRRQRLRRLLEYSFDVCSSFGKVLLSENKKACALILFPDKKRTTVNALLGDLKLIAGCIGLQGLGKALSREQRIKRLQPVGPLYYLWFIGVEPQHQHKGLGSGLLKEILEDAKQTGRALCLETSAEKNLPWYGKFGFQVYNELNFGYTLFFLKAQ